MPSTLLGNPPLSGPQIIVGPNVFSGLRSLPVGGLQLFLDKTASGNAYIYLSGAPVTSGGATITSGGFLLSGGGLMDGMVLPPGGSYFVPREAIPNAGNVSGIINVYALCDAACSGQARLWWEAF